MWMVFSKLAEIVIVGRVELGEEAVDVGGLVCAWGERRSLGEESGLTRHTSSGWF